MSRIMVFLALAVTCLPSSADTVIVTAERMIDVRAGRVVESPRVVITDGRIVEVGSGAAAVPEGARQVNLPGHTLMPGLIDMHVHLTSDPTFGGYSGLEYTDAFWTVLGVPNARMTLDAGFTTVRNVGAEGYADVALKQAIDGGYIPGPRIVPATYAIGATGGHCDFTEFPPSIHVEAPAVADGPEALRATVRKLRKYGAETIKFCATGGVFSKTTTIGAQQLTLEEMTAIVVEAHMLGLKVAAHAHGTSGINTAILAGVDTVEHCSLADDESFRLARQHGTWFSMDIHNHDYIMAEGRRNGVFEESLKKEEFIGLKQRQAFQAAVKAGVRMVFGSDAGVYPHGGNGQQFAKMVQWGMTPMQALQAATINAAQALGRESEVGAIETGLFGDLVAVEGDPLANISLLADIPFVMKGGVVYKGN